MPSKKVNRCLECGNIILNKKKHSKFCKECYDIRTKIYFTEYYKLSKIYSSVCCIIFFNQIKIMEEKQNECRQDNGRVVVTIY
jgi:hypothetical protein